MHARISALRRLRITKLPNWLSIAVLNTMTKSRRRTRSRQRKQKRKECSPRFV